MAVGYLAARIVDALFIAVMTLFRASWPGGAWPDTRFCSAGSVLEIPGCQLSSMHAIPGALWELFIGVWLITKGFQTSPRSSGPRSHQRMHPS